MTTDRAAPAGADPGVDPRRGAILAVIAVCQLMLVLDSSILTIALPQAQHDPGISGANRQWVVTAYALAFGGLLLLGGRIATPRNANASSWSISPASLSRP
jgi:MFS family permease